MFETLLCLIWCAASWDVLDYFMLSDRFQDQSLQESPLFLNRWVFLPPEQSLLSSGSSCTQGSWCQSRSQQIQTEVLQEFLGIPPSGCLEHPEKKSMFSAERGNLAKYSGWGTRTISRTRNPAGGGAQPDSWGILDYFWVGGWGRGSLFGAGGGKCKRSFWRRRKPTSQFSLGTWSGHWDPELHTHTQHTCRRTKGRGKEESEDDNRGTKHIGRKNKRREGTRERKEEKVKMIWFPSLSWFQSSDLFLQVFLFSFWEVWLSWTFFEGGANKRFCGCLGFWMRLKWFWFSFLTCWSFTLKRLLNWRDETEKEKKTGPTNPCFLFYFYQQLVAKTQFETLSLFKKSDSQTALAHGGGVGGVMHLVFPDSQIETHLQETVLTIREKYTWSPERNRRSLRKPEDLLSSCLRMNIKVWVKPRWSSCHRDITAGGVCPACPHTLTQSGSYKYSDEIGRCWPQCDEALCVYSFSNTRRLGCIMMFLVWGFIWL